MLTQHKHLHKKVGTWACLLYYVLYCQSFLYICIIFTYLTEKACFVSSTTHFLFASASNQKNTISYLLGPIPSYLAWLGSSTSPSPFKIQSYALLSSLSFLLSVFLFFSTNSFHYSFISNIIACLLVFFLYFISEAPSIQNDECWAYNLLHYAYPNLTAYGTAMQYWYDIMTIKLVCHAMPASLHTIYHFFSHQ